MKKKIVLIIIAVAVLGGIGYFLSLGDSALYSGSFQRAGAQRRGGQGAIPPLPQGGQGQANLPAEPRVTAVRIQEGPLAANGLPTFNVSWTTDFRTRTGNRWPDGYLISKIEWNGSPTSTGTYVNEGYFDRNNPVYGQHLYNFVRSRNARADENVYYCFVVTPTRSNPEGSYTVLSEYKKGACWENPNPLVPPPQGRPYLSDATCWTYQDMMPVFNICRILYNIGN